jgi:hypothetical protein
MLMSLRARTEMCTLIGDELHAAIKILDIIHRPVFYSEYNVSNTDFSSRIQVEPIQLGPIDRYSLQVRRQRLSLSFVPN